jgi:hypothetical protein
MFITLQVATLVLVAIAMALALAHALELPGKLRLSKEEYLTVQPIYYPGFTIGGAAEPAALLSILALMLLTPPETPLWLTAGAFAALAAMHAIYWLSRIRSTISGSRMSSLRDWAGASSPSIRCNAAVTRPRTGPSCATAGNSRTWCAPCSVSRA